MSVSGEGGYRVGDGSQVLKNLLAYFGFPFAPRPFAPGNVEIQAFPFWDTRQVLRLILPHLVLIGLILWRAGTRWALIYLIAFDATLLPVLPISKYETQYTYAEPSRSRSPSPWYGSGSGSSRSRSPCSRLSWLLIA